MFKALDIETMPNEDMIPYLPEPEVKTGNLKDPVKIELKIKEARDSQVEKMALNPLYGRIISYAFVGEGCSAGIVEELTDEAEKDLISEILEEFADDTLRLFTWNGKGFDLPFIYKRAMILGINMKDFPRLEAFTKRYSDCHYDLMQIWDSRNFTKLDNVAKVMLGQDQGKLEIDFKDFPMMMRNEAGRREILKYNVQDTQITYELGMKMSACLF
jgi:predicted PolB exonuclease-like 3'-5' exonuclease